MGSSLLEAKWHVKDPMDELNISINVPKYQKVHNREDAMNDTGRHFLREI